MILKELCRYNIGTYADIINRNALLHPDSEAFVFGEDRITFSRFNSRVNRLVNALLSRDFKKGDVLGILSGSCHEYFEIIGAAMKGGFIASPFNIRLNDQELEYIINYSDANVLFIGQELVDTVKRLRPRIPRVQYLVSLGGSDPGMLFYDDLLGGYPSDEPGVEVLKDDPFIIIYTSGTTGAPRGSLYSHGRMLDNTRMKALEMGVNSSDRNLLILPLFHIAAQSHAWPFFYVGACNVIMSQKSFDPELTLKAIEQENATDLHIVPTHLHVMLNTEDYKKYNLGSLKRIYYAASPMPFQLLNKGLEVFGPIFSQGYGQSESGPQITELPREAHNVLERPEEERKILKSCGQPSIGVHARIVDEKNNDVGVGEVGEIIVQSESIMVEYWRKPEETLETIVDGWLHTGDMAYYDERGFIYIVDRKKDMIISGGENVYSREVEEVIYKHPAVSEVAVIGVPDPVWVERVHGVIVLKEGASATGDEIISFCKKHIASYKVPKSIDFVESIAKSPQGKILKKELKRKYDTK
ncbi:MAG: long-chain-fatty-acid--CoA ligase [Deltaproteobacteria bacterium]|nr:long-chain-fatty-acid--CoA ligase [Deltaproteobacteria bacterium]